MIAPVLDSEPPSLRIKKSNALETLRLSLDALVCDDLYALQAIMNDPETARMTHNIAYPFDRDSAKAFLDSLMASPDTHWAIRNEDGALIGLVYLRLPTCRNARAIHELGPSLSIFIHPAHQGEGYGGEALSNLIYFWRKTGAFKLIQAAHFSDNKASSLLLDQAGFVYTGRRTLEASKAREGTFECRHMVLFL